MRRLLATLIPFLLLAAPADAAWTWPVPGDVITPYRNGTDPYAAGQHRGIDIAAPVGTAVRAAATGEVRFAGTAGSSGMTVSVRTSDGYDTSYLHLSSLSVRAGAHVSAGERIGAVGTTGTRSASAPHLHFGVRTAGSRHAYHDPLTFLTTPQAPPKPTPQPSPEPAPAPTPAPGTPPPAAAPAPAGRTAPARRTAPVRHRAPQPTPFRRAVPRPAPLQRALRRATHPDPLTRPAPALGARPNNHRPPALDETNASPGVRANSAATASEVAQQPGRPASTTATEGSTGPDIGWALACAGLLLAAGVLGLTDDGRRTTCRTHARLAAALRPLLARR